MNLKQSYKINEPIKYKYSIKTPISKNVVWERDPCREVLIYAPENY